MSRFTLRLPETLHHQLVDLAAGEGVSLNQYIVYALTRQVTLTHSVLSVAEADVQQQRQSFNTLRQELGTASPTELIKALSERDLVSPEQALDADTVALFKQRIQDAIQASPQTQGFPVE